MSTNDGSKELNVLRRNDRALIVYDRDLFIGDIILLTLTLFTTLTLTVFTTLCKSMCERI